MVFHSSNEVIPKSESTWIFSFLANFFHVKRPTLEWDYIFVFFLEETWNFSCCEMRIDSFQEGFELNFSVIHQEGYRLSSWACLIIKDFRIFHQRVEIVTLSNCNLEEEVLTDERCKSSE